VLQRPYEATGAVKARLFVSSDCSDTDFTVKLTDVYPDGRSMLITDGILRMRNRNGTNHWELMNPGTVYQVDVDLWSTSYIWNTGHRIRVDISSSNYPRCLNNLNTADGIYKNTTYSIAHNTLYIDNVHSSCLLLPEIPLNTTDIQKNRAPSIQKNILIEDHPHLKLPERLQNILNHIPILNQISEYRPFMLN
jgi:putative CocE/NonD family hydrolase